MDPSCLEKSKLTNAREREGARMSQPFSSINSRHERNLSLDCSGAEILKSLEVFVARYNTIISPSSLLLTIIAKTDVKMKKNSSDQQEKQSNNTKKSAVWGCDSSLYDSFELQSLKQQLESALTERALSMPRLPEPVVPRKKPSLRIVRSMRMLLRSVFRVKPTAGAPMTAVEHREVGSGKLPSQYQQCGSGGLATIPEGCEESPELGPAVRKAVSERFAGYVGIFR